MREWSGRFAAALAVALGVLCLVPAPAVADIDPGVRAGFYSNQADGAFVGIELLTEITGQWFFNPNLEYVFVDDGSLWTLNADAHYDLDTRSPWAVWVGGGAAVIFTEIDPPRGCRRCEAEDDTEVGLNLLAGAGAKRGAIRPYIQGKFVLSDDTAAAIAFGLRFH
jgi:hypothetical protein